MFICQVCGKNSKHGERCTMIVTKRKLHQHPFRTYGNWVKTEDGRKQPTPDEGGKGVQTVKEIRACLECSTYDPKLSDPAEIAINEQLKRHYTEDAA